MILKAEINVLISQLLLHWSYAIINEKKY